jgi:hypothetical protein
MFRRADGPLRRFRPCAHKKQERRKIRPALLTAGARMCTIVSNPIAPPRAGDLLFENLVGARTCGLAADAMARAASQTRLKVACPTRWWRHIWHISLAYATADGCRKYLCSKQLRFLCYLAADEKNECP